MASGFSLSEMRETGIKTLPCTFYSQTSTGYIKNVHQLLSDQEINPANLNLPVRHVATVRHGIMESWFVPCSSSFISTFLPATFCFVVVRELFLEGRVFDKNFVNASENYILYSDHYINFSASSFNDFDSHLQYKTCLAMSRHRNIRTLDYSEGQ